MSLQREMKQENKELYIYSVHLLNNCFFWSLFMRPCCHVLGVTCIPTHQREELFIVVHVIALLNSCPFDANAASLHWPVSKVSWVLKQHWAREQCSTGMPRTLLLAWLGRAPRQCCGHFSCVGPTTEKRGPLMDTVGQNVSILSLLIIGKVGPERRALRMLIDVGLMYLLTLVTSC